MLLGAPDEPISLHVDTNCLYLLPGSFHLIPHFAMIPYPLAAVGDRIFYAVLRPEFAVHKHTVKLAAISVV